MLNKKKTENSLKVQMQQLSVLSAAGKLSLEIKIRNRSNNCKYAEVIQRNIFKNPDFFSFFFSLHCFRVHLITQLVSWTFFSSFFFNKNNVQLLFIKISHMDTTTKTEDFLTFNNNQTNFLYCKRVFWGFFAPQLQWQRAPPVWGACTAAAVHKSNQPPD